MKKLVPLFLLWIALGAISCGEIKTDNTDTTFTVEPLVFNDSVKVTDSLTATYKVNALFFKTIKNKTLLDSIYRDFPLSVYTPENLKQKMKQKANAYFNKLKKEPDFHSVAMTYFQDLEMKMTYHQRDFLAIAYDYAEFTGGAHPNHGVINKVFDLDKHRVVQLSDLIAVDSTRLSVLLMKNLPLTIQYKSLGAEASHMLLVDKIPVTGNFYFDQKNLYFSYTPYEITPYYMGDVVIPISWSQLAKEIKPDFRKRMNF